MHELVFTGGVQGWPRPWFPCTTHNVVHMWRRDSWRIAKDVGFDGAVLQACGAAVTDEDNPRPRSVQEHCGGVLTGYGGMSWGKPVLPMAIACSYVPTDAVVWDPCAGSGSSLIACERHGRRFIGMESQPRWAQLIGQRWAQETGEEVVLRRGRSERRLRFDDGEPHLSRARPVA